MADLSVTQEAATANRSGRIVGLARLMRPQQWTKNAFCFAGLIFGGKFMDPHAAISAGVIFLFFCAASSCMYTINDLVDLERDRLHPRKKFRPLPSGEVSRAEAAILAGVLGLAALLSFPLIDARAYGCLVGYMGLNLAYSNFFKHQVLVDVAGIATGFVLRMLAGVYAVDDLPTTWITLCTFFLALFLGFSKRRAELAEILAANGNAQRPVLAKYNLSYLDSLVSSTATMTIMTYALFTVTSGKNPSLVLTVPFVHIAIMLYKLLVSERKGGEEPERIVLKNRPIQICILLWMAAYLWITHSDVHLFK